MAESYVMWVKAILRIKSLQGTFTCRECSTTQKVVLESILDYWETLTVACVACGAEYCYKLPRFAQNQDVFLRGAGDGQ
jgi:transcription elongation factor Elf1